MYTFQQCGLNGQHKVKPLMCCHKTIINSVQFRDTHNVACERDFSLTARLSVTFASHSYSHIDDDDDDDVM